MKLLQRLLLFCGAWGACELVLWAVGYGHPTERLAGYSSLTAPHTAAGWQNRVGTQRYPSTDPAAPTFLFTVWDGGERATGPQRHEANGGETVVFLGDSFTQGAFLDDDETFPWLVQAARPDLAVRNFGTGGYGTCQSLIRMRELAPSQCPDCCSGHTFIYGFSDFHEPRNIAHPLYAYRIARISLSRSALMPRCFINDEQRLSIAKPERFADVPITRVSRFAALLVESYHAIRGALREGEQRPVTKRILREMHELAQGCGGRFIVMLQRMSEETRNDYVRFFEKEHLEYFDAIHPQWEEPEYQIPNDGHPNELVNSYWRDKVLSVLTPTSATNAESTAAKDPRRP